MLTNINTEIATEVKKRRTFAIISHPDAGKTTITEKLLLHGGAIRLAGTVKGRKAEKFATSDWMEIEKQRGISVTSSAMQFSFAGHEINILDTPGHQDFCEDTYRTLLAADCAVMLIDAAKGVEAQTIKLFQVCRMQHIPVFTFINKMDRYGKEPLALLEELEEVLGIRSCPMNWPIGMGSDFMGIYNRSKNQLELAKSNPADSLVSLPTAGIAAPEIESLLGASHHKQLCGDIELLNIAGDPFDAAKINEGMLTPVFFGSALSGFGVLTFLEEFLRLAPPPGPRASSIGLIDPIQDEFSGFVFKIQANMNPAHRDRLAFLRVCSGKFERNMSVCHVRTKKKIRLTQPQQFLAQDRSIIETAYPGDIIGLFDPGVFNIGDTLSSQGGFSFDQLPRFSPEHFAKVAVKDAMRQKQFYKGMYQLAEEGSVQIYKTFVHNREDLIIGVVGELQFEVFLYRLKNEYGVEVFFQRAPYQFARWIKGAEKLDLTRVNAANCTFVKDQDDELVALFESEFNLNWMKKHNPELIFQTINKADAADDATHYQNYKAF